MTVRHLPALVAAVGATLLLASCADQVPAAPTPASTPTPATSSAGPNPTATSTAVTPPPTGEAVPFPADVTPDEQAASEDAALTLTDVTTGQHPGYDRVVLRFDGTGTPGWMVRYVDAATDDPADTVLDVAGDGTLQVVALGVRLPFETGIDEWAGPNPVLTPDYAVLREVNVRGQFEGQELAFLGVAAADLPFRVFALADPTRLVVDVRHDG